MRVRDYLIWKIGLYWKKTIFFLKEKMKEIKDEDSIM